MSRDGSVARAIPWRRIFAESVAIVLSILFAFTIDAWWAGRQAADRERLVLEGLRADFLESGDELDEVEARFRRVGGAARALLALTGPTPGAAAASKVDSLIAQIIVGETYESTGATLASLIDSEGLGTLSNQDLRVALSRWSQQEEALGVRQEWLIENMRDQLIPFLFRHAPIRTLDAISSPEVGGEPSRFAMRSRELLSSLEFENQVNERLYNTEQLLEEIVVLQEETERVLELLADELER